MFAANGPVSQAESGSDQLQPLVRASADRMALAREVAFAKWDSGAQVDDPERESQVLEAVAFQAKERGLDEKYAVSFFRAQIEANKVVQYRLLADWHRAGKAPNHSPVDLKGTVRPRLDKLQTALLDDLSAVSAIRLLNNCHAAVADAVATYLKGDRRMDELESIALDRSLGTVCSH